MALMTMLEPDPGYGPWGDTPENTGGFEDFIRPRSTVSLAWHPTKKILATIDLDHTNRMDTSTTIPGRANWGHLYTFSGSPERYRNRSNLLDVSSAGSTDYRHRDIGEPYTLLWHPSGKYLLAGTFPNAEAQYYRIDGKPMQHRIIAYRLIEHPADAFADYTLQELPHADMTVRGAYYEGSMSFDRTGDWLAVAGGGYGGDWNEPADFLARFNTTTGAMTRVWSFPDTGWLSMSIAWHPTDATLLARGEGGNGYVSFWRRDGDRLTELTDKRLYAADGSWSSWHPSGKYLLTALGVFSWPGLDRVADLEAVQKIMGDAGGIVGTWFDPGGGDYLAGGPTMRWVDADNGCGGCGDGGCDDGCGGGCDDGCGGGGGRIEKLVGLTVARYNPPGSITVAAQPWPDSAVPVAGEHVAWGLYDGQLYLAASRASYGYSWSMVSEFPADQGWSFNVWKVGAAGTSSQLSQKQADGRMRLVGTATSPLSITTAAGVQAVLGGNRPLSQKQADGTWRKVIG